MMSSLISICLMVIPFFLAWRRRPRASVLAGRCNTALRAGCALLDCCASEALDPIHHKQVRRAAPIAANPGSVVSHSEDLARLRYPMMLRVAPC
jgi:hypothetical protein